MHLLRDSASIQLMADTTEDTELSRLIHIRINELAEYVSNDLGELIHIAVVDRDDLAGDLDCATGYDLTSLPTEAVEEHDTWFEVTYVLGSDGFGIVVFIPKHPDIDPGLQALCHHCSEGTS